MDKQALIMTISFILGVSGGTIMHRSDFCIAGMFRDLFLFRASPLLRSLTLAVAASMLLFELTRLSGLLSYQLPSSLFGLPSLTNLFGGILFGIGMVIAGGCVVGTLYKMGAGNLPALCSFFGLIIGSTLYAEFHPLWNELTVATRLSNSATLPQLMSIQSTTVYLMVLLILCGLLLRWQIHGQLLRPNVITGYLQPRTAALLLALVGVFSFTLTGMPIGVSTSYAKFGSFVEQLSNPEHVAGLSYFQSRGFEYFSPLSQQTFVAGAGPFWDGLALVQFPLIIGIIIGACCSALLMNKFQFRFKLPPAQLISAISGGILMGLAARMAPACNIWHLLGGLPLLSLQSILFTLGLFPGAWLGTQLLTRFVLAK